MEPQPPPVTVECALTARDARVLARLLRKLAEGRFLELAGLWSRQGFPTWSHPELPAFLADLAGELERRAGPARRSRARLPVGPPPAPDIF